MTAVDRRPAFEIRHVVSFEETNLVGNVYFVRHLSWQGRCRELFLRAHAPDVVDALAADLALTTLRCDCEYFAELFARDEVAIRMRLERIVQNRIALRFDYVRVRADGGGGGEQLVARGHQEVACMRRDGAHLVPTAIPESLREALRAYECAADVAT
jgi:enediyne biosynthesis thioesterase